MHLILIKITFVPNSAVDAITKLIWIEQIHLSLKIYQHIQFNFAMVLVTIMKQEIVVGPSLAMI